MGPLKAGKLDPINLALIRIFRAEVRKQGATQSAFAARAHISQTRVSRKLRGEPLTASEVINFCAGLGLDPITVWVDAVRAAGLSGKVEI